MAKGKFDDPAVLKKQWEELIQQTTMAQKNCLDLMIQLRKELSALSRLKENFPESTKVPERIKQCDQLLEQSSQTLEDIKKELAGFKKQKDTLEQLISPDSTQNLGL